MPSGPTPPVLAAGGIGRGSQIAAAIAMGAQGAWTGSIWLTVAESDMAPLVIEKLLAATSRDTVRSRSLTGKPARQLRTAWTDAFEREDSPGYLPMPLQFMLVSDAYGRINRSQDRDLIGAPVGQIVGQMNAVRPVRDVMFDLVDEYVTASRAAGPGLGVTRSDQPDGADVSAWLNPGRASGIRRSSRAGARHAASMARWSAWRPCSSRPQGRLVGRVHDRGGCARDPWPCAPWPPGRRRWVGTPRRGITAAAQATDLLLQPEPEVPAHRLARGHERRVARRRHGRGDEHEVEVLLAQRRRRSWGSAHRRRRSARRRSRPAGSSPGSRPMLRPRWPRRSLARPRARTRCGGRRPSRTAQIQSGSSGQARAGEPPQRRRPSSRSGSDPEGTSRRAPLPAGS